MEQATELEYLRYFYEEIDSALGPASDDIYVIMKENFVQLKKKNLPEGYGINYED